jgi:hypothetical protein
VPGHERSPSAAALTDPIPRWLADGELELVGVMPNSSNGTFLVRATRGREAFAIYKPASAEAPLWDFPDGTLCRREVAAWELARALGWPRVPPTVLRDGPLGEGSVQLFVPFDPREHFFTLEAERADEFRRIALFDVVANNADRKAGHCLLGEDGVIRSIDHGVCFHDEPKLRTVIWTFAGEPIPAELAHDLRRVAAELLDGPLAQKLDDLLTIDERAATSARAEALLRAGAFPAPDMDRRPFPWPPI